MSTVRPLFAALATCALFACSSGEDESGAVTPIDCGFDRGAVQVTVVVDAACNGCGVDNSARVADGDLAASARVTLNGNAAGDGVRIRVTRTDGGEFTDRRPVGFYWSNPDDGFCEQTLTYRNGVEQSGGNSTGCIGAGGEMGAVGSSSADAYDAVEVRLTAAGGAGSSVRLSIDEICAEF